MAKPFSKDFVLDASILKTAGEPDKSDKKSVKCCQFLQEMRRICHRAILTPEIEEEWDKHQSKFASRWRVTMISIGKIVAKPIEPDPFLRNAIIEATPDRHVAKIMLKDARLIERPEWPIRSSSLWTMWRESIYRRFSPGVIDSQFPAQSGRIPAVSLKPTLLDSRASSRSHSSE